MLSSFKHELKSQGAEEASRDPDSNISANDAEQVILEESKKGGAAAFQFNPNASPAEKAAQARSVSLAPRVCCCNMEIDCRFTDSACGTSESQAKRCWDCNRHGKCMNQCQPFQTNTWKDDGTPNQYDLPAPSTAGALPPPSRPEGQTNGVVAGAEEWDTKKYGWAPRFGTGDTKDDGGANLIDHQTMLEASIDDKFFGGMLLDGL